MSVIEIVCGVVRDDWGRVLVVRKAGTRWFMLPGGKREPGEMDLQTLGREIAEETGCALAGRTGLLGRFSAPAANEPGQIVKAAVYVTTLSGVPQVRAEIEELAWVSPEPGRDAFRRAMYPLAPLLRTRVLPALRAVQAGWA